MKDYKMGLMNRRQQCIVGFSLFIQHCPQVPDKKNINNTKTPFLNVSFLDADVHIFLIRSITL